MHILITNDDGIFADGIYELYTQLRRVARVSVVAPDTEQSARGHAITLTVPLRSNRVRRRGSFFGYSVNGTPADCVKIAIKSLLDEPVDMVVSGINLGANTGTSVIYSGTVSAATEGSILGVPSLAISLATLEEPDFRYAARFARRLCLQVKKNGLPPGVLLNVNVPPVPEAEIRGVAITKQGRSRYEEVFEGRVDPRGNTYYWLDGVLQATDTEEDSDLVAVQNNYVSVTPIHYDLTAYTQIEPLRRWELRP